MSEKVVLITGSARGIGAALARGFAARGHAVVINYLSSEAVARRLRDEIVADNGAERVLLAQADVTRRAEVNALFDRIEAQFGRVDALINNAGVNRDGPFLEMSLAQWSEPLDVILTGTFHCSQEFALRYRGSEGHILTIGALTGLSGRKNGVNYCTARAGILAMTKCLALELAPRIRVNCVTPGYIATEEVVARYQLNDQDNYASAIGAIPLDALGSPEDILRMAYFLICEGTYITGQNFLVDGGKYMR